VTTRLRLNRGVTADGRYGRQSPGKNAARAFFTDDQFIELRSTTEWRARRHFVYAPRACARAQDPNNSRRVCPCGAVDLLGA
jgi:hypothetical protein